MSFKLRFLAFLFFVLTTLRLDAAPLGVKRAVFPFSWESGTRFLKWEILDDDLIHFEILERCERDHADHGPKEEEAIWTSPLIDGQAGQYREGYQGPSFFRREQTELETADLRIEILAESRCFRVFDKQQNRVLTEICAEDLDRPEKRLVIRRDGARNFYGIGNLFVNGVTANGDWAGHQWNARKHGNFRFGPDSFFEGGPSVSQFPVLYSLAQAEDAFALLLDHVYRLSWDFTSADQTVARTWGDELRGFILSGKDIRDLRRDFMQLTGRPPVPPKSLFGHWTSEFGYDNWEEVEKDVRSLRQNDFPLDGVALDLQWFGAAFDNKEVVRMGTLQFATPNFKNPRDQIKRFYDEFAIQFMPIEESYVDNRLDDHRALCDSEYRRRTPGFSGIVNDDGCFLARHNLSFNAQDRGWNPVNVTTDINQAGAADHYVWWGRGGMLDWTNPYARKFWHQLKRVPLSDLGIFSHWLDLGEPEMYFQYAYYYGFPELFREFVDLNGVRQKHTVQQHGDIHNVYNLLWAKGIKEGYERRENESRLIQSLERLYGNTYHHRPRHFTMSRAGTVGSQRYGGMWSGDVMGNFENLRGHLQTQLHLSLAGMDYYGSDSGGFFHAGRPPEDPFEKDIYTQWFATSSLLDTPLRPHGWGLDESIADQRFGADVRGHLDSNRANVRRRYELIPYTYSLAHLAYHNGDPIYPPLVYHFPSDERARQIGDVKMIGPSLLFGVVASRGQHERKVYLPSGTWFDYENGELYRSHGEETRPIPLYRKERVPAAETAEDPARAYFMIPLFARAGAIIPGMWVDEKTMNALGRRKDGSRKDDLIVKVFADSRPTRFTLFEDDGVSVGYQKGEVRTTQITQSLSEEQAEVVIGPAQGNYVGAVNRRPITVEWVVPRGAPAEALVNGRTCQPDAATSDICWWEKRGNKIRVTTRTVDVTARQRFVLKLDFRN